MSGSSRGRRCPSGGWEQFNKKNSIFRLEKFQLVDSVYMILAHHGELFQKLPVEVYPKKFQLNPVPIPLGDRLLQKHVGDALGHLDAGQLPRGRVLGAIIYFECGWK